MCPSWRCEIITAWLASKCEYADARNSCYHPRRRKSASSGTCYVPATEDAPSAILTTKRKIVMRTQKGFSLIELLIVVAIILIIAAIAIPNLVRARMAAYESSAANSVRTANAAQVSYESTYPSVGYSSSMAALGPPAATG